MVFETESHVAWTSLEFTVTKDRLEFLVLLPHFLSAGIIGSCEHALWLPMWLGCKECS